MSYFINVDKSLYSRLMLFTWSSFLPTNFSQTNAEFLLKKMVLEKKGKNIKNIFINCNNIMAVDDHVAEVIEKAVNKHKIKLYFFSNDNTNVFINHLKKHAIGLTQVSQITINDTLVYSTEPPIESELIIALKACKTSENELLQHYVRNSFVQFDIPKYLSSTPLKTNGEFNASEIISDPYAFRWLIVSMVDKIDSLVRSSKVSGYTLVSSSLRGSAIAGAVWGILSFISGAKICIFDHIGPKYYPVDIPKKGHFYDDEFCIYIGDFMIAGTEIKITEAYCRLLGGHIKEAFVIGKYSSVSCIGNKINVHSLVQLKECIPHIEYTLE